MNEIEYAINNHSTVDGISPYADSLIDLLKAAQSRLESLEKDAARYRWLRDYHDGECGIVDEFPHIAAGSLCDDAWALSGRKADAAIDTAMQANKD